MLATSRMRVHLFCWALNLNWGVTWKNNGIGEDHLIMVQSVPVLL
jgi:hypothetical protein